MGQFIGYSVVRTDAPNLAIIGFFKRFNEARRKLEEISKNEGKYKIQEEWIGEPTSAIVDKRRN